MTLYPDVQRKAQEELDSVVGTDRLPELADKEDLPYLDALVKEVLRWNPVAPLGKLSRSHELMLKLKEACFRSTALRTRRRCACRISHTERLHHNR